jgi:hypothetical protein
MGISMNKLILIFVIAVSLFSFVLMPAGSAFASSKADVCDGVGAASGGSGCTPTDGVSDVNKLIRTAIRIFQSVVGIIALIMMVTSGLRFVTSGGDPGKVTSARNTLLYAAVGIVVVALSEVIIQFVLNRVTT